MHSMNAKSGLRTINKPSQNALSLQVSPFFMRRWLGHQPIGEKLIKTPDLCFVYLNVLVQLEDNTQAIHSGRLKRNIKRLLL